jgi:hypothetical protein
MKRENQEFRSFTRLHGIQHPSLRYFEWVPFDPRGIRGEVNNLELRNSGRE